VPPISHESKFEQMTPEEKTEFFALLRSASPEQNPPAFEFFALVVGGKVAHIVTLSVDAAQEQIGAMSSDPKVVKLNASQKNIVALEWDYDASTGGFSAPE